MARFRYPAQCLTHKCQNPNKSLLYIALHAPSAPLSELDPALGTHLREHFGVHSTLYPQWAPAAPTLYLQPVWNREFHELSPLATIHGAIIITDAGTTPARMAVALAYEHALERYKTKVASGLGTS